MSCSKTCISADGVFEYVFEDLSLTHQDARMSCSNRGWTLATNLTLDDYQILDNCCNTTKTYRIGLVKHQSCSQDSAIRYSWLTSQSCNDGSPLNITGVIPEMCQAVAIPVGKINDTGYNVRLSNCSNRLPYICQKAILPNLQTFTSQTSPLSGGGIAGIIISCLLFLVLLFMAYRYLKSRNKSIVESTTFCGFTNSWFFSVKSDGNEKQENINILYHM